ncbi:MAG: dihydropteroate synthase [Candidatus Methanoplasma sp.]|jgi:dihydropteroate synthase|nr:dihydropteroate synthase [Candidatus Methanoplasma sp.]
MKYPSDLWGSRDGRPLIMGILNVTPDSFSDGGAHFSKKDALEHAYRLIDEGADIVDVGGESTRPGSDPVSEEEELKRVIGVIKELAPTVGVPISIDTAKPRVADGSVKAGASMVNDIWGLRNEAMADVVISRGVPAVIMHMHGTPKTLAADTMEGDALAEIKRFLDERAEHMVSRGMDKRNIILDPGVGFGKTAEQNMAIVSDSGRFGGDHTVLIGPSRKRFLSQYYPDTDKDDATAIVSKIAADSGAGILRVHDVRKVRSYLGQSR